MRKRLAVLDSAIPEADPVKRLQLIQERMDLSAELDAGESTVDLSALEADFVTTAKAYSDRKGISYAAWRELGIEPTVLKAAGIARTRS